MLIRSQDKSILINMNNVSSIEVGDDRLRIFANNGDAIYDIGEYSTEAKVIKVLDMIQEAYEEYKITCTFLTGFTGHRAIVESNDIQVNGFKELVKSFKKNMVFQMPEDSEVEA